MTAMVPQAALGGIGIQTPPKAECRSALGRGARDPRRLVSVARRRDLLRLGLAVGVTAAVPRSPGATPEPRLQLGDPALAEDQSQALQRELGAVARELMELADGEPALQRLLERLSVRLDNRLVALLRPNAAASLPGGRPLVQIDVGFVLRLMRLSDLAGLFLLGTPEANGAISPLAFAYGVALRQAQQAGRPAPEFAPQLATVPLPPWQRLAAADLSYEVSRSALAWVVLHEIGHHALGHLSRTAASAAQSRADELAADRFATERMLALGYAGMPLRMIMQVLTALEQMQAMAGFPVAGGAASSHPAWDQRKTQVETLTARQEAPRFPFYAIRSYGLDATGAPMSEIVSINSDPAQRQHFLASIQSGRAAGIGAYEWIGGTVRIYLRPLGQPRQEIRLSRLDRYVVDCETLTFGPQPRSDKGQGFHVNIATRRAVVPGLPGLGRLPGSDESIRRMNRALIADQRAADAVTDVQVQGRDRMRAHVFAYYKGETELARFAAASNDAAALQRSEIARLLGQERARSYQQALDSFMDQQILTEEVLGRLDRMSRNR